MSNTPLGFPFGVFTNDNTPVDGKYYNRVTLVPYADVAEAVSLIPLGLRYKGLTININGVEYWWPAGSSDLSVDPIIKESGGGSSTFADLTDDPYDNTFLAAALNSKLDTSAYNDRFKGKYTSLVALETAFPTANAGDYAQVDAGAGSDVINYNYDLEEGWIQGGSGSGATDTDALPEGSSNLYFTNERALAAAPAETTTSLGVLTNGATAKTTPVDADMIPLMDSAASNVIKKLSWANLKASLKTYIEATAFTISTNWRIEKLGAGIAANVAAWIATAVNTATVGQLHLPKSAVDYTGTLAGMIWNNAMEFKFYDDVIGGVNRLLKLSGNSLLANSNALNVVTSTGTGGNLGTLKAEVAFGRYPTAASYTVLLTDIGFGWIIAVTDTTATRTITLPLANTVPAGWLISMKDESGGAGTNVITIAASGSDTFPESGGSSYVLSANYLKFSFYSDGVSKWFTI